MTDRDILDRARAALDGITDGPWMAGGVDGDYPFWVDTKPDLVCIPIAEEIDSRADAEFIADAPELIRGLVDALESALHEAEINQDACDHWHSLWRQDQETAATALRERDEALAEVERLRGNQRVEELEPWLGKCKGSD